MAEDYAVYLVDDDHDFRAATKEFLTSEGLNTRAFKTGAQMLVALDPEWEGIVLCDVRMREMDGFAVLKQSRAAAPDVPVVMMTGHGDVRMAIAAIKQGAYDFLEKPMQPDFLLGVVRRSLATRKLIAENRRLRRRVARYSDMRTRLIGTSKAMKLCRKELLNVAPLPLTVVLFGEPGTGKGLAARTLHEFSEVTGDFATVNCSSVIEEGLRQVLDQAEHGTLYLRGIHTLPAALQNLLSDYLRRPDRARVIVSTNTEPDLEMARGALSEELYYLVTVAKIELPPLRARDRDMFLLLETFLRDAATRFGKPLPHVSQDMLDPFSKHDWSGNVRELRNIAERMIIGLPVDLPVQKSADPNRVAQNYDEAMAGFERVLLEQALVESAGRKGDAATLLDIPRKRFYLRLKAVGLS